MKLLAGNPLHHSLCGNCEICIKACPVGAINQLDCSNDFNKKMINKEKCINYLENKMMYNLRREFCGLCMKECPVGE